MKTARPYSPRHRRDPLITQAFWAGVYRAVTVGLFAGLGLWGLLLLGGASLTDSRREAVGSLLICGLAGAVVAAAWEWGRRCLELSASEVVAKLGRRLEFLILPFIGTGDEEAEESEEPGAQVEAAGIGLAIWLLAPLVGIPLMITLLSSGKVRTVSRGAIHAAAVLGAAICVLAVASGWQRLMHRPDMTLNPPPPQMQQAEQDAEAAAYDSNLELAVAKARMAKDEGNKAEAIDILEGALNEAAVYGRAVSHPQLHRNLAWLYAEEGNVDGAIVMFETVMDLVPEGSEEWQEAEKALGRLGLKSRDTITPIESSSTLLEDDAAQDTDDWDEEADE